MIKLKIRFIVIKIVLYKNIVIMDIVKFKIQNHIFHKKFHILMLFKQNLMKYKYIKQIKFLT